MTDGRASAEEGVARRWRVWVALVALLPGALALLAWSGQTVGTSIYVPWAWRDGWLMPSPSLVWLWLAGAGLAGILSGMAYLLHTTPAGARKLRPWTSAALIGGVAVAARVAVSSLDGQAPLAGILLDLLAVGALMLALHRRGRSLWWALLYAAHPLVLMEVAALGTAAPLGVLLVAGVAMAPDRPGRGIGAALWLGMAVLPLVAMLWLVWSAERTAAGALPEALEHLFWQIPPGRVTAICVAAGGVAVAAAIAVGLALGKSAGATGTHAMLIALCFLPRVSAAAALLPLAGCVFWWNRGAWVLSVTALAFYALPLSHEVLGTWDLPDWLSVLVWTPVVVVEIQQLIAEWRWGEAGDRGAAGTAGVARGGAGTAVGEGDQPRAALLEGGE